MRKKAVWSLGVLAAVLLVAGPAAAQTTIELGRPVQALWNGPANEADAGVVRYEARIDSAAVWTNTGVTIPAAEYSYTVPQTWLTLGAHALEVRGCSADGCGPAASASFTIVRPLPGLPRNPRVVPIPSTAALTIPEAVDRAQAYGLLILDRRLTEPELLFLASRHPPVAPTRDTVLLLLDSVFTDFVIR